MSLPPGASLFVGMFIILGVIVFFPYIIKFIRFTGLWLLPVEVLLIDTLLVGKVLKLEMTPVNYPEIYPVYETAMVVLWVATVVLVTGYHLYKLWEGVASQDASPVGAGAHCGDRSRYLQTGKRFIGLKAERTPTGNVGVLFSIDMK